MVHFRDPLVFAALCAALCLGCGFDKDKQNPAGDFRTPAGSGGSGGGDTSGGVSYAQTIAPMMAASCTVSGCHGANPVMGIGLDSYDNVKANAVAANTVIQDKSMPISPPGAALTDADRQNFQSWVNAGAPNN